MELAREASAFGPFQALRERPIPDLDGERARKQGYRAHPVALDGAAARERLADALAAGIPGRNHYAHSRNPPYYEAIPAAYDGLVLRAGVLARLAPLQAALAKEGLSLWLFDAWRPDALQRYMHDVWMPAYVARRHPGLSPGEAADYVDAYWAAPTSDRASPAPHLTGGALDVTLCWRDTRELLWMGSIFDDAGPIAWPDHFERRSGGPACLSDEEALHNRRLLYWLMSEAGFCNNPTEWWHFSYGDQMWARLGGHAAALYGAAMP